jgi:cytochrome c-type biogenesis protein
MAGAEIGLVIAFIGGVASFASPCFLPLMPAYVGYVVGTSSEPRAGRRRAAFYQALAFVLGFSTVFVAFWAAIGLLGYVLGAYVGVMRQVMGALIVFMGLQVAGVINVRALARDLRLPIGSLAGSSIGFGAGQPPDPSYRRSAVLGIVFAAGWTPCIGPILGGIVGLASVTETFMEGTALLVAYTSGLAVPFILAAVGATAVTSCFGWLNQHHRTVSAVTGALLVIVGVLMVTNTFGRLSGLLSPFGG